MGKHLTNEELIKKLDEKYKGKFDFSKIKFVNLMTKVKLFCKEHGEFWQRPTTHLSGCGCPKCGNHEKLTTKTFIEKAEKIHNNKYDYSKVEYVDSKTKIYIICPKHGEFWQTPNSHLKGDGCPLCKESRLEKEISQLLINNNVIYKQKYHFDWLGQQHLDLFLPKYNIAIECQGVQHYEPVDIFGGNDEFIKIQERDQRKKRLCKKNGIKLLYYTNYKYVKEDNKITFKDKEKLLRYINEENAFTR